MHHSNIVTVGYGLRNLASSKKVWKKCADVAKPGGRLVVLDFGKLTANALLALAFISAICAAPCSLIGRLFCGNADCLCLHLNCSSIIRRKSSSRKKCVNLKLVNVRVINLLGGAMAINYGEKPI